MNREIVFDTETTGLNPATGDRVVEIGCLELVNHIPSGRTFHVYLNPDRSMPEEAFRVHGLSDQFLADKPRFAEKADEFLAFVDGATLIAHNAGFDIGFLNAELSRLGRPALTNKVIDTVEIARRRLPGARVSLDALCKQFGIDNSRRTLHGALLDSEILAEVYLELIGGRQVAMALVAEVTTTTVITIEGRMARQRPVPLAPRLTDDLLAAHNAALATLKTPLWTEYYAEKIEAAE